MRKIVSALFITLDGVTEEPSNWQEHFDDDMMASLNAHIDAEDTIVMGRHTYEYWYQFWPTATFEPFASHINGKQKYVASRTLDHVEWGDYKNIALLPRDIVPALQELKQQPGKNIAVAGSPTLVRYLIEQNVLDELELLIHPVLAGKGERLFSNDAALKRLDLVSAKPTSSGTIIAVYHPRA